MVLGGSLVLYQILDARRWSKSDFRSQKHTPGIFSLFLLVLPFVFGGLLAFEGFTLLESVYRSIILWSFTITFWSVILMVPLALYSKNREDNMAPAQKFSLISVLIPAYNEEKVIARIIESALEIDYPKKEIIIIDDGIIDDKEILEIEFYIPENSKRETLTVTINTENENSKSSKILQIFSLGRAPSDGASSP